MLRAILAAAVAAAATFCVAPAAVAQGSIQIQDAASTADPVARPRGRMGTPQLGGPSSGQKRQPKGFMDTLLQGPRLTTTPPEPADWVRRTRPPEGAPAPKPVAVPSGPARPALTPDEVRRREAALDATRRRHDQLAGRKGGAASPPARAARAEQKAEGGKPRCVMTCSEPIGVRKRR